MPTDKEIFEEKMDALADAINTKAGTSGAKGLDELRTTVEGISVLDEGVIAEEYDSTKSYTVGEYCLHETVLYRCIGAATGTWDSSKWVETSVSDEIIATRDGAADGTYGVGIVKITSTATTLGDVNTLLNGANGINPTGKHVFFDVYALGASMYLCTILIDTTANIYRIFDVVNNRCAEGAYDATKLLTMCIANADVVATQSQIDALQKEINDLGGKTVVEDWDKLGDMIKDGTSTNVVSAGDVTDINWIATVIGSTTNGLTVSCSNIDTFANGVGEAEAKTYLFVYNGSAWTYNEEVINLADYAITVLGTPATGEVMTIQTTVTTRSYTFTGYDDVEAVDANVPHNWLMEQTYAPDTKVFNTYDALFSVYQGKQIPVGNYHLRNYSYRSAFYVDMYLNVTTAIGSNDYAVQAQSNGYTTQDITNADDVTKTVVYAISGLTCRASGTRTNATGAATIAYTPASGVTYTELEDLNVDENDPVVYIYSGAFDKCALGNATWIQCNMAQWLNDETGAKSSVTPTYPLSVPSAYNLGAGFLFGLDPRVKALIQPAKVKWTANYADGYTQNQTYTAEQKAFLLSMKEMSFNINTAEGEISDLYGEYTDNTLTNDAVAARAKYNKAGGTLNSYRWSRSARTSGAFSAWFVPSTGSSDGYGALIGFYFAPAFIIGKSTNP